MNAAPPQAIVIVGSGAAGYTATKVLRAEGFTGSITMIGSEQAAPYRRPAVSKELLTGSTTVEHVRLGPAVDGVTMRTGVRAVAVTDSAVLLDRGDSVPYDALLLATGSRARQIELSDSRHVFTLRSVADVAPLQTDIVRTGSLLVIGGGLIGCEAAAAARSLDAEVTVLERAAAPLSRIAPNAISQMYLDLHAENGIDIHTDVSVSGLVERSDGTVLVTAADGRSWSAGTVLVSVGSVPNVELGAALGLDIGSGIVVDAGLRTSAPNVYAAGDVAEVPNRILGGTYRSEHWNGALDQATRAARAMLGVEPGQLDVPWGWSTQHGLNLQFTGWTSALDDYVIARGSVADRRFTACAVRDGRLVGAIGIGFPKDVRQVRAAIASGIPVDTDRLTEAWLDEPQALVR